MLKVLKIWLQVAQMTKMAFSVTIRFFPMPPTLLEN